MSMVRRAWSLLFLLVLAASAAGDGPGVERTPDFVTRVNRAIDRGATWLRERVAADTIPEHGGCEGAVPALVFHTLRVCGASNDDPAARVMWERMREKWRKNPPPQTYTLALYAMAIAERGRRLPRPDGERTTKLDPADETWMREIAGLLEARQTTDGTWTYLTPVAAGRGAYDHSNTQYALLGLKAAARCGVAVKPATWRKALEHLLDSQEANGPAARAAPPAAQPKNPKATQETRNDRARGWGYTEGGDAYGSMTAGGTGSVVICRSELLDAGASAFPAAMDKRADQSIRDGLAWLGHHFTVRTNPGPRHTMAGPGWHYYYLYALERAGVLAAVDWMGTSDWYGEGAEFLMAEQKEDGRWQAEANFGGRGDARITDYRPVTDTCFALLFLKKGTIPVGRGSLTEASSAKGDDLRFEGAADLRDQDFGDLLDIVLSRWRRNEDEAARKTLFDRATAMGPRLVEPLLVRMASPDWDDRRSAFAFLSHATGQTFGYEPTAAPEAREDASLRWQMWWFDVRKRLVHDPAANRLVVK
ncbi:MAG: hypothetical protein HMLKMBBP_02654 [Planctomycetes bacterium]|nr:hypothetical protein [Planctomycetota bacterium]